MFKTFAACVLMTLALSASAWGAATPKLGTYNGTSSTNVPNQPAQTFSFTLTHGTCTAPGATARHRAYCVSVNTQGGPQTTCGDGSIVEEFFPIYEPIALSSSLKINHTYALYADTGGQLYYTHAAGTTQVGTFAFTLSVATNGHASGTMNYDVNGCSSGPLTITAKR